MAGPAGCVPVQLCNAAERQARRYRIALGGRDRGVPVLYRPGVLTGPLFRPTVGATTLQVLRSFRHGTFEYCEFDLGRPGAARAARRRARPGEDRGGERSAPARR